MKLGNAVLVPRPFFIPNPFFVMDFGFFLKSGLSKVINSLQTFLFPNNNPF